jgi:murein DD-endopeptidase MepM/ murein hydrolase activator NlpD
VYACLTSWSRILLPACALCAAASAPPALAAETAALPSLRLSPALDAAGPRTTVVGLGSPVPGARITSPFGWRVHPILKVRRFHSGVDYAAPLGTPVHATADGVVEAMGRGRHFGLFLRIRHAGEVQTAYAHLGSFASGLHPGSEVGNGQVIGTVGHSGWATGPHLDYEVIIDGRVVDPGTCLQNPPLRLTEDERLQPAPGTSTATAYSSTW